MNGGYSLSKSLFTEVYLSAEAAPQKLSVDLYLFVAVTAKRCDLPSGPRCYSSKGHRGRHVRHEGKAYVNSTKILKGSRSFPFSLSTIYADLLCIFPLTVILRSYYSSSSH